MNKILLVLLALMVIPLVYSAPPITTTQQFTTGYEIEAPTNNIWKLGQNITLHFHVFNISDGMPITSGINCSLHLYNYTGNHVLKIVDNDTSDTYDYSFLILGGNITEGLRTYIIQCNSVNLGGYREVEIEISKTGDSNLGINYLGRVFIWLVLYVFMFLVFIKGSKVPLMNLIGLVLITLNSLIGMTFINDLIGLIALGTSIILLVYQLWYFISKHLEDEGF